VDRHGAAIDAERGTPIDPDLSLAGGPPTLKARIVHAPEQDPVLEFKDALAGQEEYRAVDVNPRHRRAMGRGLGKGIDYLALVRDDQCSSTIR